MTTSSIQSLEVSLQYQWTQQAQSTQSSTGSQSTTSGSSDSATISIQGFASLLAGQDQGNTNSNSSSNTAIEEQIGSYLQQALAAALQGTSATSSSSSSQNQSSSIGQVASTQGSDSAWPGRPSITDSQAAQIGNILQQQDPALFSALDTNGSSTLTASQLQTGLEQLQSAIGQTMSGQQNTSQANSGGPMTLTNSQAAAIGTNLQSSDPTLFHALNTSGSGTLSAQELQTGLGQIQSAMSQTLSGQQAGRGDANGTVPTLTDAQAQAIGAALQQSDPSLFQALNTSGSGTLSAQELQTGLNQLQTATSETLSGSQNGGSAQPPMPPTLTDAQAQAVGNTLKQNDPALFQAINSDDSGTLTAQQLQTALSQIQAAVGQTLSGQQNGNSDGSNSTGAFTDAQAQSIGNTLEQNDPSLFQAINTSGNGTLTAQQLESALAQIQSAMTQSSSGQQNNQSDGSTSASSSANTQTQSIDETIQQYDSSLYQSLNTNGNESLSTEQILLGLGVLQNSTTQSSS